MFFNERNRYIRLQTSLFFSLLIKKKITRRKIGNALHCFWAYCMKSPVSGRAPMMISLELGNQCNANCLFCRTDKGEIPDVNPEHAGRFIPKGRMSYETAAEIIRQVAPDSLIAVLYTNGEPLLYPQIVDLIRLATENGLATMIATNGTLLNLDKAKALLEAGLNFIKIVLSGYSQEIYGVEVRHGDVEKVKTAIRDIACLNRAGRHNALIMVDYILYKYNRHELPQVRAMCRDLGVMLSVRPGNPKGGLEEREPPLSTDALPLPVSCDWLWKGIQVDWTGDIQFCCECGVWGGTKPYARFEPGRTDILKVWNNPSAQSMRFMMKNQGRYSLPICRACLRQGIAFKW